MKPAEINQMLSLKPQYNSADKAEFKRLSLKFLRAVAKSLDLAPGTYDLRFNAGGIAVSGDAILHHDQFYMTFNLDSFYGIMVRKCKGRNDYTGGVNMWHSFSQLEDVDSFAKWVRGAVGL